MSTEARTLLLHHPADPRFSLRFVTDDKQDYAERMAELTANQDVEVAEMEERIHGHSIYLLYTRTQFEAAYPDFETDQEVIEWFDREFTESDKQILFVVIGVFDGILTEKEKQGTDFSTYKRMDLEKIPGVIKRVEWRQLVPDVGAELLSYFILAHPMPNTNHRTGIGLLDRYLASYDEKFTMPDTGEEGHWYQWARDYIYDSKRVLTLRNRLPLLYWAHHYGFETATRKEGIRIVLDDINLTRDNYRSYYTDQHLKRSRRFVETVLTEADATHLLTKADDGKRAFVDRLRG